MSGEYGYATVRSLRGTRRPAPDLGTEPPDWTRDALCAQIDPDLWFPSKGYSNLAAKAVCTHCEVRVECLTTAMAAEGPTAGVEHRHGIYGGLSPLERVALARTGWANGDPLPAARKLRPKFECPVCRYLYVDIDGHRARRHPEQVPA